MKKSVLITSLLALPILFSCSSKPIQPEESDQPIVADDLEGQASVTTSLPAPFLYRNKGGKTLKLVRMMEGGACKSEDEGVVGMFMLYADPDDIDRIKRSEGDKVFADYEAIIEQFSMLALEQAVKQLDFADDPFALDEEDARARLAEKLSDLFYESIDDAIDEFESKTSLTIDLAPFAGLAIFLFGRM